MSAIQFLRRDIAKTCFITTQSTIQRRRETRRATRVDCQTTLSSAREQSLDWTAAGLTNGAKGTVHSIIYKEGEKTPQLPVAIIGVFDKYNGAQFDWSADLDMPDNAIPICPVSRKFFSGKKTALDLCCQ
jgi:hypothetical protein